VPKTAGTLGSALTRPGNKLRPGGVHGDTSDRKGLHPHEEHGGDPAPRPPTAHIPNGHLPWRASHLLDY